MRKRFLSGQARGHMFPRGTSLWTCGGKPTPPSFHPCKGLLLFCCGRAKGALTWFSLIANHWQRLLQSTLHWTTQEFQWWKKQDWFILWHSAAYLVPVLTDQFQCLEQINGSISTEYDNKGLFGARTRLSETVEVWRWEASAKTLKLLLASKRLAKIINDWKTLPKSHKCRTNNIKETKRAQSQVQYFWKQGF